MIKKNIIPIIVALVILFLSLTDSGNFNKINIPHFRHADKIAHLLMYAGFMFSLILVNRSRLSGSGNYLVLSLIPFSYGLLIELVQKFFSSSRSGEFLDLCFNVIGITLAITAWLIIKYLFPAHFR